MGDIEKSRRKVEGDLRIMQETVTELERSKKELEGVIGRKEEDQLGLTTKLEDEQLIVTKFLKAIKETQGRVEVLEEELEAERQARAKADKLRKDIEEAKIQQEAILNSLKKKHQDAVA